jgi:hypothetical protein
MSAHLIPAFSSLLQGFLVAVGFYVRAKEQEEVCRHICAGFAQCLRFTQLLE